MAAVATAREIFDAFRAALEQRDIDAVVGLYADDAEYTTYSEGNRPSAAESLRGKEAIANVWRDVEERNLTESISDEVVGDDRFACRVTCTYPSGERVVGNYICEVRDGRIARSTSVETWDE